MHNNDTPFPGKIRTPLTAAHRVAAGVPDRAIVLKGPFSSLLYRIHKIGIVTVLSGNDSVIREKTGIYEYVQSSECIDSACPNSSTDDGGNQISPTAPANRGAMDRVLQHPPLLPQKWKYGFAISERDERDDGEVRRGLQFFDSNGDGLYKIMLHASSNIDAYHQIVADFAAGEQVPGLDIFRASPPTEVGQARAIAHIDIDALRADWARANNTEEFLAGQTEFDSLRLYKLRLAGKAFAHQVANDSVRILLQKMADLGGTIMAFIGNAGIVQAYQGRVKQIRRSDVWLNIVSPDHRLQLREDHIDSVWVAKKPTTNGVITSLELFNRQGVSIARFFSMPEPGRPEPREWRDSIMRLLPVFGA